MEENMTVCPKNYMVESVLVTLFCCLPFGIIGIINAGKVATLYANGQYDAAQAASNDAKKWMKRGLIFGGIFIVLYFIFMFVVGFATAFADMR